MEAVINEALKSGAAPNVSDAHTINGHPGPLSLCSSQGKELSAMKMSSTPYYFTTLLSPNPLILHLKRVALTAKTVC